MALSETAARMMATLPIFYSGEPILERIVQSWANEVDRMDAQLDAITDGLVPALCSDELGFLAIWEFITGLPPSPPGASQAQRLAKVLAVFQALQGGSATTYIAAINTAVGAGSWTLLRNTPGSFQDTLQIPYNSGGYNAQQIAAIVLRLHPAHRQLFVSYEAGFLWDAATWDLSTW